MQTNDLFALASSHGHHVSSMPLKQNKAFAVEMNGKCFVALATGLPASQELELLAHELGHCEYAGFYTASSTAAERSRCEARARRWAYTAVMPIEDVNQAMRDGNTEIWQLAEHFGVSPEFAYNCMMFYRATGKLTEVEP